MTSRAVFLDRNEVINADRSDFVKSWEEFEFLPARGGVGGSGVPIR
jgi:histidinol phosphatase-like enzyme